MPERFLVRLGARLITVLSALTPAWRRDEWRDEWLGELHYRASRLAAHNRLTRPAQLRLLARCAGAVFHVIFLWKHEWGIDMLRQDVRYGLRMLARRKGFSLVAALTLALGIGATTAIFSAVHAVLLKRLPYPAADRLVRIYGLDTRPGQRKIGNLSVPDVGDFQRRAKAFDAIGAHNYGGYLTLTGTGEPERVPRLLVSSGYFRVLQAQPALGRLFRADEDRPGPPDVAVISHGFWQRRFAGDPQIVGRTITLSGFPATVVGVLPPSFVHPDPAIERAPDVFTLLDPDERQSSRGGRYVRGIARMKPGVSLEQGLAELESIATALAATFPPTNTGRSVTLKPLNEAVAGDARAPLLLLQGATLAILLIACVNLANLLLGAAAGREGELTVRAALGASRRRLVRQLLTESLLLAVIGGALGTALAVWGTSSLSTAATESGMLLPQQRLAISLPVLVFATAISLAAGLVFGLMPALHVARGHAALLPGSRRHTAGPGRSRTRAALIAAEVALSVALLVGASLLIKSFRELTQVDPGFRTANALSFQLAVSETQFPEGTQQAFYERLYDSLRSIGGVSAAGGINILPLSNSYSCDGVQVVGRVVPEEAERCAEARSVSSGYFEAMEIPLLQGRWFTPADDAAAPRVVVVNAAFAREFFPEEDPVGKRIIYSSRRQNDPREIVGVVGDVHHFGLAKNAPAEFYTPQPQPPSYHGMTIVIRGHVEPAGLMAEVRNAVRALAPDAPIYNVKSLPELVNASVADARFRTLLLGLFAALALTLAVVGTYGVVSLLVSQRAQEMGVRLALGASPREVVAHVITRGLQPVVAGAAGGLAAGYALARAIDGLLFNVRPGDPATFAIAALVILAAGLLATWIPARRACRVDPAVALRAE